MGRLTLETSGVMNMCKDLPSYEKLLLILQNGDFDISRTAMDELETKSRGKGIIDRYEHKDVVIARLKEICSIINNRWPGNIHVLTDIRPDVLAVLQSLSPVVPKTLTIDVFNSTRNIKKIVDKFKSAKVDNAETAAREYLHSEEGQELQNRCLQEFLNKCKSLGIPHVEDDTYMVNKFRDAARYSLVKLIQTVINILVSGTNDIQALRSYVKTFIKNDVSGDINIVSEFINSGKNKISDLFTYDSDVYFLGALYLKKYG